MRVAIMIEGALGLNWEQWQAIAKSVEKWGFDGLYRSDHFLGRPGESSDALEAWTSLTWAAANTERIEIGTLVSPLSFRDPRILAWQATAVNDLAGGRLHLGLGAGWQEEEHEAFGFDLGTMDERFDRFEEGLQVITALTRNNVPMSFTGKYFSLKNALLRPRSDVPGTPKIIIGGNGPKRTLPLVAKYADEWNAMIGAPELYRERSAQLDRLLESEDRDPASVVRSQMCGAFIRASEDELQQDPEYDKFDEFRSRGAAFGTPSQIIEIINAKRELGIEKVMLQWLDVDDLEHLQLFAEEVLPHVQ